MSRVAIHSGGRVVSIDIGGANLKLADDAGRVDNRPLALWRNNAALGPTLRQMGVGDASVTDVLVTITGELADCYPTRRSGVLDIVDQVSSVAGPRTRFYRRGGRFVSADEAVADPLSIAASNWDATARWVGRAVASEATVIDIGSTTTDVIPVAGGVPINQGVDDPSRLMERSLMYIGGRRTPVCSLVSELPYRGLAVSVMNEMFATIDDARILLGFEPQDRDDSDTANGRSRSHEHAAGRMLRMVGSDTDSDDPAVAASMAAMVHAAACGRIAAAVQTVVSQYGDAGPVVLVTHYEDLVDITAIGDRPIHRIEPRLRGVGPCLAMLDLFQSRAAA